MRIIAMRSQPVVRAAAAGLKHTAAVPRQPTLVVPLVGRLDASRARASHTTPNPAANKPSEPEKSVASAVDPNTPAAAAAAADTAATATVAATGSRAKLRQLVVQYGTLAMVTHVVLSLCSLGGTYALVAAGLDTAQIIEWLHIPASKSACLARCCYCASADVACDSQHRRPLAPSLWRTSSTRPRCRCGYRSRSSQCRSSHALCDAPSAEQHPLHSHSSAIEATNVSIATTIPLEQLHRSVPATAT